MTGVAGVAGVAGVGIGWRPDIAGLVADLPGLGFAEVIAESLPGRGVLPQSLQALQARGVHLVAHGVSLSLGGTERLDRRRVRHFARTAARLAAPIASEHIAFVRAGGIETGHLLPVPRTREAADVLVRNVRDTQRDLDVPLALEPIAALFEWPRAELTEAEFLSEILERTGALLLLDVANVYANARNAGRDPATELARLPQERIAYCHVAGGSVHDGLYHDTHTDPVPAEVLALVCATDAPAFLLERDGRCPPAAELWAELDAIADAAGFARITGDPVPRAVPTVGA